MFKWSLKKTLISQFLRLQKNARNNTYFQLGDQDLHVDLKNQQNKYWGEGVRHGATIQRKGHEFGG